MKRVPKGVLWAAAVVAVAALAYVVQGRLGGPPYQFASKPLTNLTTQADFTLQSASGPVSLSDFDGDVVVLYFGYTHCPNICPTEMMHLAEVRKLLPEKDRSRVKVLMITVDPERDSPVTMAKYAHAFDPAFVGLSGTSERIAAVAKQFFVTYQKTDQTGPDQYFVNHTSAAYVLDTKRQLALIYNYDQLGSERAHIAQDLHHLLSRGS